MAKVEQKVGLNITEHTKGLNQMGRNVQGNLGRINRELDKSGDSVKKFSDRTKKNVQESKNAFTDLVNGVKGSLGAITAIGAGVAIGAGIKDEIIESLSFDDIINRISAKAGLNRVSTAELRNQLLDISSRRNIEEDEIAAAADVAINLGAAAQEAVKFADVIATATKSFEGLEPRGLAQDIARDIRARGGEVTAEEARKSIEAVIAGTRAGIGDFNDVLQGLIQLPGPTQRRAGLSQRDLVELLGGAAGVAAEPELINDAIRALIRATDKIEQRGAVQGVLGTQLRDAQNRFDITAKDLDVIQRKLSELGTEQQRRAVIENLPGFDERSAEGLLALIRDRVGFEQARERVQRDRPQLEQLFEKSTSGILEQAGAFFNRLGNQIFKKTGADRPQQAIRGRSGAVLGKTQAQLNAEFEAQRTEISPTALPSAPGRSLRSVIQSTIKQSEETPAGSAAGGVPPGASQPVGGQQSEVIVKVEVDSKDPGLTARPKATDVQRQTGGF